MEINVIVICITLIIITFFVYMLFKDKKASGSIEYDTKTGKLLMKKIANDNQRFNNDAEIIEPSEALQKQYEGKKEQIKNEKNCVDEVLSGLDLYKEFSLILHKVNLLMIEDMATFIIKNGILQQTDIQYNIYIKNKIKYYTELLNNGFSQSKNEYLKNMNTEILMGTYKKVIFFDAVQGLGNIYENHKAFADKKDVFLKNVNVIDANEFIKKIMERLSEYEKGLVDLIHSDLAVSLLVIQDFTDTLHGLFIQYIKDFFQKK